METWQKLVAVSGLSRAESWILACYISKLSYVYLRSHDDPVSPSKKTIFKQLIEQRLSGVPIAYLVNEREFYGHSFFVDSRVLIPRHETEKLIDIVLKLIENNPTQAQHLSLLDLGTGSGIIPITIALETSSPLSCIGIDLSADAIAVARINQNRLQDKKKLNCQWMESNWFNALSSPNSVSPCFDIITSNPPYIHSTDTHLKQGDLRFEPRLALSDEADGLSAYRIIIEQAANYLKPNGYLVFEHGYDQANAIYALFRLYPHWQLISTECDLSGLDRCTYAQYIK